MKLIQLFCHPYLFAVILLFSACNKYSNQLPEPDIPSDIKTMLVNHNGQQLFKVYFNRLKTSKVDSVTIDVENLSNTPLDSVQLAMIFFNDKKRNYDYLVYTQLLDIDSLSPKEIKKNIMSFQNSSLNFDKDYIEPIVLHLRSSAHYSIRYAGIYNNGYLEQSVKQDSNTIIKVYAFAKSYIAADGSYKSWFKNESTTLSLESRIIDSTITEDFFLVNGDKSNFMIFNALTLDSNGLKIKKVNNALIMNVVSQDTSNKMTNITEIKTYLK